METWQIVLIVAAVAAVIWYLMKNRAHGRAAPIGNQREAPLVASTLTMTAPGVDSATGQVRSNPPPAPPADVNAQPAKRPTGIAYFTGAARSLTPVAALQHVPIVGNAAGKIANAPTVIADNISRATSKALAQIPIAGSTLASVNNVAHSAVKKVTGIFGF
jgi:hypothetical protein